ncbi:MAG TPA: sodium-dependent transporter [Candidatus Egerieimonas intestinavium]|uniref:Sodium-dependent transporter n=1 Tax=Candidatus Egerieimonas intestinavium TaxID=2840777 RepID=A0A9D1EII1_9FIRM|nr:sodium-dependent transporter [Candidatus Egerieimonas intestinavium]
MSGQITNDKHQHTHKNGGFHSSLGFVLACVGSAVGMGNIWMFPYRVGQYGGAAFLIPYLIFVAIFGTVGLSAEFAIGRRAGTGTLGAYKYCWESRKKGKIGAAIGWIPLLGSLGIAIGYSVIVGWVVRSLWSALSGQMMNVEATEFFAAMKEDFSSVPWHVIVVVIAVLILMFGATSGIEKVNKFMMPAFFILFAFVAIRVAFLPDAIEGYKFLFVPRWEYLLKADTWIMAMGQAFFSLSITGSGMIVYGTYLKKSENIPGASVRTAVFDTLAAMLSALAIMPAVFSFGIEPNSGPPLIFITLPTIFQQIPMGRLLAVFFFVSVVFAGITSLINMFEAVSESWQHKFHLPRKLAVSLCGAITFVVGLFLEAEPKVGQWMDFITILVVPFGALLGAISIYFVLGYKEIRKEMEEGRPNPMPRWFGFVAKYVYVPLAVIVFILGIVKGGIG